MRHPIKMQKLWRKDKSDKAPLVARKHPIRRLQTSAVGVCGRINDGGGGGIFMLEY